MAPPLPKTAVRLSIVSVLYRENDRASSVPAPRYALSSLDFTTYPVRPP